MTSINTPSGTITPLAVDGYEATREVRNVVHPILNRSNPDITFRAPGLRTGTLSLVFPVRADALAAYAALSTPGVMSLVDPSVTAVNMSFVVADGDLTITLDAETRTVWLVEVPFVEVTP